MRTEPPGAALRVPGAVVFVVVTRGTQTLQKEKI
jgi:hypothetical protein